METSDFIFYAVQVLFTIVTGTIAYIFKTSQTRITDEMRRHSESIERLTMTVSDFNATNERQQTEIAHLGDARHRLENEMLVFRQEISELRVEISVLRTRIDSHIDRQE